MPAPEFGPAVKLPDAAGRTEPRVAFDRNDKPWVVTNDLATGDAIVYSSPNGGTQWTRTGAKPAGQNAATIDVDIVTTHTGRIIASELDFAGINFPTSYSDDNGATWTASRGTALADQDRQWLAVGPDDAATHQPRVYLLYHNLVSGFGNHNMWVMTSTDGGATFGPPVPITKPGDQAYLDLQCADSGGPGSLGVNSTTGRIYAVFGTRSSAAGGCGAQPIEANIVAATRVWVATSPDGSIGSWTQSLAVDDSATGQIVGMQLATGALDKQGNLYVAYPESPRPYPDYSGAAIMVRWAPADLSAWSSPVTIAPSGGAGNLTPHVLAGEPGKIDVAYYAGELRGTKPPLWYATVAQSLDLMSATPHVATTRLAVGPAYAWSANEMMGACSSGALQGIENGFNCDRSTDVWGVALDSHCMLTIAWPSSKSDVVGSAAGTWMSTQQAGPPVCGPGSTYTAAPAGKRTTGKTKPGAKPETTPRVKGIRNTRNGGGSGTLPATGIGGGEWGLLFLAGALVVRRTLRHA